MKAFKVVAEAAFVSEIAALNEICFISWPYRPAPISEIAAAKTQVSDQSAWIAAE